MPLPEVLAAVPGVSAPLLRGNWQHELAELPDNWDHEKAKRITPAAISTVESFATVPMCDGGIQIEVHRDGFDIEICVGPDGRIESALVCVEKK